MGRQTKRVEFPVCASPSWTADNIAVMRDGGATNWWHPKAVHALDFVNGNGKRGLVELPLASCLAFTRDSAAFLADASGVYQNFSNGNLARVTGIGADFEGQFTNRIRNPRGEGGTVGVIGSGGAVPTNWAQVGFPSGLASEFVGTGARYGKPYTRHRVFGTPTVGTIHVRFGFDFSQNAVAAAGQAWGADFHVELVAGTATVANARISSYLNSTVLGNYNGAPVVPNATLQHLTATLVVPDATTNNVQCLIVFPVNTGIPYDFTIDIFAPKLVQLPVIEGAELVTNGDFSSAAGWAQGTGWSIGSGVATKAAGTGSDLSRATTAANASVYKLVYTVSGRTAGQVTGKLGAVNGTARTGNGTFTDSAGYMPTYPILPPAGTPGDSTRAADVATTVTFDWFAGFGLDAGATELAAVSFSHMADGVNRSLFELSDGTANNYVLAYVNASDRVALKIVAGGVVQTDTALAAAISLASRSYAFGWSAAGGYVTSGSETVTFGAITVPALTQKRVGGAVNSNAFNDVLVQLQSCALMMQAEAAAWATSH